MKNDKKSLAMLLGAMCIFGTIGLLRRSIPLPSSLIALVRGAVGTGFLLAVSRFGGKRTKNNVPKENRILLPISGAAIGFNWIALFEAYNHTSVATATLCYYLAPVMVVLLSPVMLGEKLTFRKILCALIALAGMIPISGVSGSGFSGLRGIGLGIAAAVLYASVILMNKKMAPMDAVEKTVCQLGSAAIVMVPYVLLSENIASLQWDLRSILLLLTVGIVHTGIAYWMYFSAMGKLKAQTTALFSYVDPILAIILSAVLLQEPMGSGSVIGAVMILGAAIFSELS